MKSVCGYCLMEIEFANGTDAAICPACGRENRLPAFEQSLQNALEEKARLEQTLNQVSREKSRLERELSGVLERQGETAGLLRDILAAVTGRGAQPYSGEQPEKPSRDAAGGAAPNRVIPAGWGPERPTYTMEKPADHVTFNSLADNPVLGDERQFVRIAEAGSGNKYGVIAKVRPGRCYRVMVYYHNNASEALNAKDCGYRGIARDARMRVAYPDRISGGTRNGVSAGILSSNATPNHIWSGVYMEAEEDVVIRYVKGSARVYNQWRANGTALPDSLFSASGALLGLDRLNGMLLAGPKYSGQVVFTLSAEKP